MKQIEEFNHSVNENCYLLQKTVFGTSDALTLEDHLAWQQAIFVSLQTALVTLVPRIGKENVDAMICECIEGLEDMLDEQ